MEPRQASVTRHRTITSCSNCYRRKQKCNRRRPCNNCTARKLGHECFYETILPRHSSQANHDPQDSIGKINRSGNSSTDRSPAVRDHFGYSSIKESNAFVEAGNVLPISSGHDTHKAFPDSVRTTLQKYWQLVSELPSALVFDKLIATYLTEVHWIYCIIEPRYLNDTLIEWRKFTSSASGSTSVDAISPELRCFPAMLFQLLATSLLHSPSGIKIEELLESTPLQQSQKYSDAGVEIIQLLGYQGTSLVGVQHDLLRAAWLKNRGRGAEAWHALSTSIRKAQDLKLHRRGKDLADPSKEEFWHSERKKRLWITLYIWDSNMSILLGRPRLINAVDCDAEPPIDCDIPENLESANPSTIQAYVSRNATIPSSVCMNLFMYLLSQKIHEIRTLGADERGLKDYSVVQRLHYQIASLLEDLPPAVRGQNPDLSWDLLMPVLPRQREKMYTCAQSLLVALHRPHVAKHTESRQRVQEAALNVLDSQQRFFDAINRNHYAYFGNAFFSIDAAVVLSTIVSVYPCKDIGMLRQMVGAMQQAMGMLSLIETQNELAPFGINIVRSCYQIIKDKYDESKHANSTVMSDWLTNTERRDVSGQGMDTIHRIHDFSEPGDALNMGFPVFNAAPVDQDDFAEISQYGRNEFDNSYWTEYRQQVFADAIELLDGDMYQSSPFG
ncbi:uncharacterized protein PAC_07647 [Phialocephala subalpina]|uniref:Zn(2)-C6 fungal-type domain-containing protein n=1 Tax=Phialocephala subalpina TaxID=576137 RepID=A0A1L7WYB5_9HELO|nr:uncharacterized protein PAC_07647 [Phialocephala subalpina]